MLARAKAMGEEFRGKGVNVRIFLFSPFAGRQGARAPKVPAHRLFALAVALEKASQSAATDGFLL